MAFFAKALQTATGSTADSLKPELLGSIRVAVVGEPSVGKTALTELIASGAPARSATRSTAGCHIHVKLVDNAAAAASGSPHSTAAQQQLQDSSTGGGSFTLNFSSFMDHKQGGLGSLPAQRKFFVELWDVSGQPKYSQLRSVFFKQLNGVILVYDVTNRASLSRLQKWAAEVAQEGSFVAPLSEDLAARNIGGLPVPVLVVGNKADRLGFSALHLPQASSFLHSSCAQVLLGPACSSWWPQNILRRWLPSRWGGTVGTTPKRPPSESSMAAAAAEAGLEPHLLGLSTSAAAGQVDWDQLNGFFRGLWERRYQPATAGAAAAASGWGSGMQRIGSFTGHPSLGGVIAAGGATAFVALAGAAGGLVGGKVAEDARLDDNDWV